MSIQSVVLLGGPDSGKTNYVGRLWPALEKGEGALASVAQPDDIGFVLDTAEHLFAGHFAPRTDLAEERRDFEIPVRLPGADEPAHLIIPDISGELWRNAVLDFEIDAAWMRELNSATGALLFVRVGSDQDVRPLDWVNSKRLLSQLGQDEERSRLPTQVMLCELIRFLEHTLARNGEDQRPRLAMIVSAWDRVDEVTSASGPVAYIEREYPLLAGRLADISKLEVRTFGLSVVGGDLKDDLEFRDRFLDGSLDQHGWVLSHDPVTGEWQKIPDVTLPLAWALGA